MEGVLRLTISIKKMDDLFESRCKELDIASFGTTYKEAEEMIVDAIKAFLKTASVMETKQRLDTYVQNRTKNRFSIVLVNVKDDE